jgi:hypothetical protein
MTSKLERRQELGSIMKKNDKKERDKIASITE